MTMPEGPLRLSISQDGVARLTLNRPNVRNALDEALIDEICEAMGRLNANPDIRVVVITGAGTAFCGGLDLNMMRRLAGESNSRNKDDARRFAHMLQVIYGSPKPTIALINGPAVSGGVGLIAACDIAIARDDAFFALSEARVGLAPAAIAPFVIKTIGERQARRYFLTGERFDAATAEECGLIQVLAAADELDAVLESIVENLLLCGPTAQSETKDLFRDIAGQPITDRLMRESAARIAKIRTGAEGREGVEAYLEKRAPKWVKTHS